MVVIWTVEIINLIVNGLLNKFVSATTLSAPLLRCVPSKKDELRVDPVDTLAHTTNGTLVHHRRDDDRCQLRTVTPIQRIPVPRIRMAGVECFDFGFRLTG